MMKNINIYSYEHKQSLELKTSQLLLSGTQDSKNLNIPLRIIHPLQIRMKQKGSGLRVKLSGHLDWKFKMSLYLQSFWVFTCIPLGADELQEGDFHKRGRRAQRREQGSADWYLHFNPGQTWGHFPAYVFLLFFYFAVSIFALKPKIHSVIFKLFSQDEEFCLAYITTLSLALFLNVPKESIGHLSSLWTICVCFLMKNTVCVFSRHKRILWI